jgi:hypothetical protein
MHGHLRELAVTKEELFKVGDDVSEYVQALHAQGMNYMREKQDFMNLKLNGIKRILDNMERVQIQKYQNQLDSALMENNQHPVLNNERQMLLNYQQNNHLMHLNNMNSNFAGIEETFDLDINGTANMSVNKSTLCKVPGSDLAKFFTNQQNLQSRRTKQGKIFVDREPEPFQYMIMYLRNNFKIPKIHDEFSKQAFELELAYWKIPQMNHGL